MTSTLSFHLGLLGLGIFSGLFCLSLAIGLRFRRACSFRLLDGRFVFVLLADKSTKISCCLLSLINTGLGLGSRLAKSSSKNAADGSSISTQNVLGVNGVIAQFDELGSQ